MATELVNLSAALAGAVAQSSAAVVAVHGRPRIGASGFIWRPNLIVTSSEGVRAEDGIQVLLPDGRFIEGRLRGRDSSTDLALIEADTGGLAPANLAPDRELKVGQLVLAVGRTDTTGPIASFGIISGVSGQWKSWRGGKLDPFVRLDVSVYATSSGGAAVDASGRPFGLVSTALSRSSVLAITRTTIERVAQKLLDKGYVSRAFLGIALQPVPLPRELKDKLQLGQDSGIILLGLEPEGPAAMAGFTIGDVLLNAGGETLSGPEALANVLDRTAPGETLSVRLLRAGALHELKVRVGERPSRRK